jgi:mercuric ion transport protein
MPLLRARSDAADADRRVRVLPRVRCVPFRHSTEGGGLLRVLLLRLRALSANAGRRGWVVLLRERLVKRFVRWADTAGVLGAIFAALCCAGASVIVSVLAAIGLSALRNDRILWPLMGLSLIVAIWGLASDRRVHRRGGPLLAASAAALALVAGVVFVHGLTARLLINAGAIGLLASTAWNWWARRHRRPTLTSA